MQEKLKEAIRANAEKATNAKSADDALKYSQAALNVAHVLATLENVKD